MDLVNKALRLASQLKKAPTVDPAAVIRSALGAAGLMGGKGSTPGGPHDFSTCLAPAGLGNALDALLPGLRRGPAGVEQPAAAPDTGAFVWRSITGAWGTRRYRLLTPEGTPQGLVVMLHGCSQNPDDFAAGTGMNAVAAAHGLLVAYPEQTRSANPSGCWNWFNPADQARGQGEPALIAAITREVAAAHDIAPRRCFVAGLSAGGAMAAIMAETYPDLYGAVGIHSGLPYRAATDMGSAFAAMQGSGRRAAGGPRPNATPLPLIVIHGDADRTVHPDNAEGIVAALAFGLPGLQRTAESGVSPHGQAYRRTIGRSDDGRVRFEDWRLAGAGHAWAGGSAAGSYTDPAGVDASREMVRFFLAQDAGRRDAAEGTAAVAP